jgi:hypothetical protein
MMIAMVLSMILVKVVLACAAQELAIAKLEYGVHVPQIANHSLRSAITSMMTAMA